MTVTLIACVAHNRALGYQNQLLYHIPADMTRFKHLTMGHTVVMGRKTYESLPIKPLPGRRNIVISTTLSSLPGCTVFASWHQFVASQQFEDASSSNEEIFVIGGAELYRQTIVSADRLCLTVVDDEPHQADVFFPPYEEWTAIQQERHSADVHHPGYAFIDFVKRP